MQQQQHDVVVIGGGLGGLLCAVMLAKEGMKVCVLEKNRQIGGCLQTFALHKKVFDACVHYIGGLGDGHTLHRIFQHAGIMDPLPLQSLDQGGFDHILFGDELESYPLGTREYFVENLLPHFPKEEAALNGYLSLIENASGQFPLYNLKAGNAAEKRSVLGLELMNTLRSLTKNERLTKVLAGNNLLYAGVEGQTPFYNHAMSLEGYLHSAHKVLPGSSQMAKLLWKELLHHGGVIHRHAEVKALHSEAGIAQFAETADGERWEAKHFISAVHPSVLFALTDDKALRPVFRKRVKALPHTPPAVMLNLVLKPGTVRYSAHNVYWHPSGEVLGKQMSSGIQWPDTQALFYTEDSINQGFAESVSILAYANAADFAKWSDSENISGIQASRDEDYKEQKEKYAQNLLSKTFRRFPELRDAVTAQSIATPLTFRDYTGTPGGALYGPLKDVNHPAQTMLGVRTKIPNLLLTGQNVNMHGVMGVSITAVATCAELLGLEYLLARIREAK